jgi:hypothetical protein
MEFLVKAKVHDPRAKTFAFPAQKTMYGGVICKCEWRSAYAAEG